MIFFCAPESDDQKINELKETMLQYAQMERDLKQFLQAVDCVKDEVCCLFTLEVNR